ncbi:MAG: hypothetical protein ACJAVR_003105 [Paracoccaceae bacterium]|jgi:hypothetical protein
MPDWPIAAPHRRALRIAAALITAAICTTATGATRLPGGHAPPAATMPGIQAGTHDKALFDLHFGGIWAGTLDLALRFDGDAYTASAQGRTEGLVGALYGASFSAEARGDAPGGAGPAPGARPDTFNAKGSFGGDKISLRIAFGPTAPRAVTADPAFKPKPYQIDPAAQTGVFDPLGAAALLLRERPGGVLCDARIDVFDGRRRSQITLAAPTDGPSAGEIQCDAALARVAGWKPKDMRKPPFSFRLFFTHRVDNTPARLKRFEVDTRYGMATAVRRN